MGSSKHNRTIMKTFILAALATLAAAAPHGVLSANGVAVAHGHSSPILTHASPVLTHASPLQYHAAPVVSHASPLQYHAAPVQYHAAPVTVAHPATTVVAHAAPVQYHAAPVQYHAAPVTVAHAAPASYETEKPYSYQYGVADDYSNSNFNAAENADAAGNVQGSYTVALPDGRIQTVKYTSDNYNGYVADVSYEGTPVYPPAVVPVAAPAYQG